MELTNVFRVEILMLPAWFILQFKPLMKLSLISSSRRRSSFWSLIYCLEKRDFSLLISFHGRTKSSITKFFEVCGNRKAHRSSILFDGESRFLLFVSESQIEYFDQFTNASMTIECKTAFFVIQLESII